MTRFWLQLFIASLMASLPFNAQAMKWDPCGIIADLPGFTADVLHERPEVEEEFLDPIRRIFNAEVPTGTSPTILDFDRWARELKPRLSLESIDATNPQTLALLNELIQLQNLYLTLQTLHSFVMDFEMHIRSVLVANSKLEREDALQPNEGSALAQRRGSSNLLRVHNQISLLLVTMALQQIKDLGFDFLSKKFLTALAWANTHTGPQNYSLIAAFESNGDISPLREVRINSNTLAAHLFTNIKIFQAQFKQKARTLSSPNSQP